MGRGDSEIYADLMRFRPEDLTPNGWALKAGVSRTVWTDMRRHGNPSRRTLEKLLTAVGSSLAEFEALRAEAARGGEGPVASRLADRPAAWSAARLLPLPLVATVPGGEWGDPSARIDVTELRSADAVERLARPESLADDPSAYALTVVGDTMWPRFRPGRRIAVSPRAPVAIGDDVLVKLKGGPAECTRALLKELVRRSGDEVELRQFNPDVTFRVPAREVAAIEKVLGELL